MASPYTLSDNDLQQEREKTEAQDATRKRDDERRAFADWLADYQQVRSRGPARTTGPAGATGPERAVGVMH
jgi:hypothetical protein